MQTPIIDRPADRVIDRLVEHVAEGRDVRLDGTAASARLAELAARIEPSWNVVQVAAPQGGLSLSALIGQLSGRDCFDDQDDSALEIGFRRLVGSDLDAPRTVLLLDAVQGLQRPVLRYLQHAGRNAPALSLAIAAGADLDALLSDPGLAPLRKRLATVVHTDDDPGDDRGDDPRVDWADDPVDVAAPMPVSPATLRLVPVALPEKLEPVSIPADWSLDEPAPPAEPRRSRRRALLWAASGFGMVASASLGAWLGHFPTGFDRLAALEAATSAPPATAPRSPPALIAAVTPPQPAASVAPPPPSAPATPLPATVPLPGRLAGPVAPDQIATLPPPTLADSAPPVSVTTALPPTLLAALTPAVPAASAPETRPEEHQEARPEAHHPSSRSSRRRVWTRAREPAASDSDRLAAEARSIPFYGTEGLPPARRSLSRRPAPFDGAADDATWRDPAPARAEPDPNYDSAYETPFIGTFSTEPYGARIYRYRYRR